MCCLFTTIVFLGPRFGIFLWWLIDPGRWNLAFDSVIWPLLGFLFAPWTTLMYLAVFPGGIEGFDVVWMALAIGIDVASWFGGGYGNRARMRSYYS